MPTLPGQHQLPAQHWGDPNAARRALLVHGLTSAGSTWWRVGEALAADGWHVTAVDLRGNGAGPVAESYSFANYAGDLPAGTWNLVVGHSLGGAVAVVAASDPRFAERLVLLDPALAVDTAELAELLSGELAELRLDQEGFRRLRPLWHPLDIEYKAAATALAGPRMVERTIADNTPWNVLDAAAELTVPTLVVGGDHAVYSMLSTAAAESLVASNPNLQYRVVAGSGHSPHRDRPAETLALLSEWLGRG